jgi:hypothetical protein
MDASEESERCSALERLLHGGAESGCVVRVHEFGDEPPRRHRRLAGSDAEDLVREIVVPLHEVAGRAPGEEPEPAGLGGELEPVVALAERLSRSLGLGPPPLEGPIGFADALVRALQAGEDLVRLEQAGGRRRERPPGAHRLGGGLQLPHRLDQATRDDEGGQQRASQEQGSQPGEPGDHPQGGGHGAQRHPHDHRPAVVGRLAERRMDGRAVDGQGLEPALGALGQLREQAFADPLADELLRVDVPGHHGSARIEDGCHPALRHALVLQHRLQRRREPGQRQVVEGLPVAHHRHLQGEAELLAEGREVEVRDHGRGRAGGGAVGRHRGDLRQRRAERHARVHQLRAVEGVQHHHLVPGGSDLRRVFVEGPEVAPRQGGRAGQGQGDGFTSGDVPVDHQRQGPGRVLQARLERLLFFLVGVQQRRQCRNQGRQDGGRHQGHEPAADGRTLLRHAHSDQFGCIES